MPRPKYPPLTPGIFRLTQSTAERYLSCGVSLELERQQLERRFATVRMIIGSAVAAGAHADNLAKMRYDVGIPLGELVEAAVTGYEREVEDSEIPESKLEVMQGKDDAADAARVYGQMVSPLITEVLFAESPIVAAIGDDFELAGTPDAVTADGVGDLKVGRSWDQEDADRSRQLSMYGLLHQAQTGRMPDRLWIDSVFRTPKGWSAQRLYTRRRPEEYASFVRIAEAVRGGIEAGVFLPAPEKSWWCSKAYCPFHGRQCEFTQETLNERIA
jgi:hypothetical protein